MVALRKPRMNFTPDEYLLLERAAECKSEYIDGRIYAMAGGSPEHNMIAANIIHNDSRPAEVTAIRAQSPFDTAYKMGVKCFVLLRVQ